ncbi:hypothetical protein [Paenibacillus alvei]|uniref:hypothetical protein n=1 Tax=Paenibacillus alvei TaxID=44250 RepID=UPI000385BBBB|nr:hypothetical protein [Paenibacillus alvei]EPY11808.1 putative acetyltransferase [Paenibacillus alvei A6-6i-x]
MGCINGGYYWEFKKSEFDFLTDMLYESIHIPKNNPNKEDFDKFNTYKKNHEGWGRKGDTALIALNTNNQAVGAI